MTSSSEAQGVRLGEPRMQERAGFLVAGLMKSYTAETMKDIPALWQELVPHMGKIPGEVGKKAYGIVYNMKNTSGFAYMAGVEVSSAVDVPDEFSVVRIPDAVFAVFAHSGHVSALSDTITSIWNEWLPTSGYRTGRMDEEMPDLLEQYSEEFNPKTGLGGMEVWVALKSRARMITVEPNPTVH